MTETQKAETTAQPTSGGCCCGMKKRVRVKTREVKQEAKPSCCTETEGEEEYPMSNTAD